MKGKSSQLNLRIKIKENSMKRKPEISLYMNKMEVGIVLNNKWSEQAKYVTVRIIKNEKGESLKILKLKPHAVQQPQQMSKSLEDIKEEITINNTLIHST